MNLSCQGCHVEDHLELGVLLAGLACTWLPVQCVGWISHHVAWLARPPCQVTATTCPLIRDNLFFMVRLPCLAGWPGIQLTVHWPVASSQLVFKRPPRKWLGQPVMRVISGPPMIFYVVPWQAWVQVQQCAARAVLRDHREIQSFDKYN